MCGMNNTENDIKKSEIYAISPRCSFFLFFSLFRKSLFWLKTVIRIVCRFCVCVAIFHLIEFSEFTIEFTHKYVSNPLWSSSH